MVTSGVFPHPIAKSKSFPIPFSPSFIIISKLCFWAIFLIYWLGVEVAITTLLLYF